MLPSPQLTSAILTGRSSNGAVSLPETMARRSAEGAEALVAYADSALLIAASRADDLMGLESVNRFQSW